VLVGGGDPTLSTGAVPPGDPGFQPASLAALAGDTARALRAAGRTTVTLAYDTSLYAGPDWQSTWALDDQLGSIAPVDALEIDEGRTDPAVDSSGRVAQPAIVAQQVFAKDLAADGITVAALGPELTAPAKSTMLASVASPPLTDLVQHMLTVSDNALAEALARQVAIASGQPGSFAGGAAAVRAEIARLGVNTAGMAMVDACGLSHADRMTVLTLLQTLTVAASAGHPELRAAITGLPVGNFSGTLDELSRYATGVSAAGAGLVRAKTGTLDSVNGLAGLVRDADGRLLVFALLSNGNTNGLLAIRRLDDMATLLLTCGCR
jgi:D-alanyl-D-alanine carboxypeptidase/D-alanyl-D-alanine-endopeptidase (penicillin-binding protein 4)